LSYPVLLTAAVKAGALRGPRRDVISWIDGAGMGIAAAIPLYVFWFGPALHASALDAPGAIPAPAAPRLRLALGAVRPLVLLRAGRRPAPSLSPSIGSVCAITAGLTLSVLVINGPYTPGVAADLPSLLACVFWTAAAVHSDAA